jgi:hypothetical protein
MALALAYGLIFATPLTLVLVPCLYIVGQDIRAALKKLWQRFARRSRQQERSV